MKITQLNSASVIIEDINDNAKSVKVLCDPWLKGYAYNGSWAIYPPYNFDLDKFKDIDFIYISHIHPDHFSVHTLSELNKNIPVLIHNFPEKFLKNQIESLGFKTIELEHGIRYKLKNNMHINIMAADNCDPTICGRLMGCGLSETKFKTTQIDTMAVFDNGKQTIVNTNDCPFDVAKNTASIIKSVYGIIDVLLVGYVVASSWPHCHSLEKHVKEQKAKEKQYAKLETAKKYIELLQSKYYIPFAGRYILCGKNLELNQYRGEPDLEYAIEWLQNNVPQKYKGIIMNNDCWFDLDTGQINQEYMPVNKDEKEKYCLEVLANEKFDYEHESLPYNSEIIDMIPKSYENFEKIRTQIGWSSDAIIILRSVDANDDELIIVITCNGKGFSIIKKEQIINYSHYMSISLDMRLFKWLLLGPQKAHWGNADIGSHLRYKRVDAVYKRGLFFCWNHFHN